MSPTAVLNTGLLLDKNAVNAQWFTKEALYQVYTDFTLDIRMYWVLENLKT